MNNNTRKGLLLCLIVCWSGHAKAQNHESAEDRLPYVGVKCGRDSAFQVCQTLGLTETLEEIDRELDYKPVVSFAALRSVFESRGLFCRSMLLNPDNVEMVAEVLREPGHRRTAIVTLRSGNADENHYVVLLDGDPERLKVWDAGLAQSFDVRFSGTLHNGAPLLLIGTDSSVLQAVDSKRKSLSYIGRSVLSSVLLAIVLALVLCLCLWRALDSKHFNIADTLASGIELRFRGVIAFVLRPRVILGLGAGALLVFGTQHLIRNEITPLVSDVSTLNIGAKPIGSVQTTSFRVKNRSLWRTFEIDSVRTSCSCLSPTVDAPVIPPGRSATVSMKVIVLSGGNSEYGVLVTPSRKHPKFSVKIRYAGYEATRLAPVYFPMGGFPHGVHEQKDVALRVHDFEGRSLPIKVSDSSVMSEGITASVVGRGMLTKDGEITLRIASSGTRPVGSFLEKIVLTTIEESPRSFLVVALGQIVPPITIEPSALFIPAGCTEDYAAQETITIHSRVGDLEFGEIDSNCDSLSVRLSPDSHADGSRRIVVEYTGKDAVAKDARIRLSVRNPLRMEFEIPVYGTARIEMPIPTAAE